MDLFSYIKAELPILDVISGYCTLRQIGGYWKGSCPFHSETDASFTVSPHKQIFYCFGCQASGDVIGFMARTENVTQLEAAKYLIERYKLKVPDDLLDSRFKRTTDHAATERYYDVCEQVAAWAHQQLLYTKAPLDYLAERGISEQQVKSFELGYFSGGLKNMQMCISQLAKKNILVDDLLKYGIVLEGRSYLYSPFEERLIFPIKDHVGRYCGFGGRIFKPGDERAKYYNSRESDGFIKGKLLFGLDVAKKPMQEHESVFLVEGYMDCIAMVQHGYTNTVATLGTACTLDHLKVLARYVTTLYILFDGDKAGQKAILRVTQFCWQVNLELKVVVLPPKEDPDSFLKNGGDLNALVDQAKDIFSFFIASVGADFLRQPMAKKLVMAEKIISLISSVVDGFTRDLLLQQASGVMQLPLDTLKERLRSYQQTNRNKTSHESTESDQIFSAVQEDGNDSINKVSDEILLLEEKIFSAILNSIDGVGIFEVHPALLPYFSSRVQRLIERLVAFVAQASFSGTIFNQFLDSLDQDDHEWVIRVSLMFDQSVSKEMYDQLIMRFCKNHWKNIVCDIKQQMLVAKQNKDNETLTSLLKRFLLLKQGMSDRGLV
jgi:DNA primase